MDINELMTRRKTVLVDEQFILSMLGSPWEEAEYINVPRPLDIPKGARVRGVYYCPERLMFACTVFHESFPVVPAGERAPDMRCDWQSVKLAKAKS
jgi:hypothetical protein